MAQTTYQHRERYNQGVGKRRHFLLAGLSVPIGIGAGLVAYALFCLIGLLSNLIFFHTAGVELRPLQEHVIGYWVIVTPALGGIVVGLMAKFGTSKIRGHGIPEAMEAVLTNRSRIAPRVAILKPLSAAIAIGTGGPFGAEGPIIQTGGALGSLVGQFIHTTAAERKTLLACGAAAGMAATFSTPIAAVILAIELLLFEFRSRSFIPLVISSTLATTIHWILIGPGPMFTVENVDFGVPYAVPFYALLGVLCGFVAAAFSRTLYWVEDQFERLPFDAMWWPAIGGLGLGIIGLFVPRVLGVGYDTISDILNGNLAIGVLATVLVFKSLALLVSLGSGTSGGLLAPMFMAGAAMGGAFAISLNSVFPGLHLSPGAFALVAMAAVFGAASRSTFAFIIFAFELTRNYDAILPLMIGCVLAQGIALLLMKNSIMTEKLARRGLRVHQGYEADIFNQLTVGEVMDASIATIAADTPVHELIARVAQHEIPLTRHQAYPLIDSKQQLVGIVTRGDLLRHTDSVAEQPFTVLSIASKDLIVTNPQEPLHDAVSRMLENDVGRILVVDDSNPARLLGYLGRAEVLNARRIRLQDEKQREAGWISRFSGAPASDSRAKETHIV
ncbi:MAG: chloride channel protein [Candidatus Hydrogenedentota bacterium]